MKLRWTVLLLLMTTAAVRADGWLFGRSLTSTTCPPSCFWCPDDYRGKPMPCAKPFPCGGCDDYDAKSMPRACPAAPSGCDDYCPKTFPWCLPASVYPWYKCGSDKECR